MIRRLAALAFASAFFLVAARARAADVAFDDRPFNLQARLGFGTSVGFAGIIGELDLHERINLGAGVGTNAIGPVGAAHVRLRPIVFRNFHSRRGDVAHALVLEASVSRSRYRGDTIDGLGDILSSLCEGAWDDPRSRCYHPRIEPAWVWWGQLEVGWELRLRSGLLLRATGGAATLLARPDWQCSVREVPAPCGTHLPPSWLSVTTTLGLGYAF